MILLILRAPTRTFLKNLFMLFLPFLISFFFQTSIHLTTGFLFPFSSVFFTFLTFFFIWLLCSKKSYKMIQKRERSFKWCIINYNFSSTTHSLNRKRRQSGFYLFCFVLKSHFEWNFYKDSKKKDFENDSFVSHFFFHEVMM